MVRPDCLPAEASRRVRSDVARGNMPYSAVIQPRPWPLSQGGSRSSSVAVTSTWVSPNFTKQEPSAYFTTPRSSDTARSSSGARRLGRMAMSFGFSKTPCFVSRARASGKRRGGAWLYVQWPRSGTGGVRRWADLDWVVRLATPCVRNPRSRAPTDQIGRLRACPVREARQNSAQFQQGPHRSQPRCEVGGSFSALDFVSP